MITRREFAKTSALAAGAVALPVHAFGSAKGAGTPGIHLGLCSYTFRNFTRAQLIGIMKQLTVFELNAKEVKDHLPMDAVAEAAALADYAAAGIKLHAAGVISFAKNDDADIRAKFEYCKRARLKVLVAGDPAPETLPRLATFAKEYDMQVAIHNHGPEDKLWPSPREILKAVKDLDERLGCCIDVGHTVRAGADVVWMIHEAGPRLFNVHMKDLTDFHDKESQVAVGEGKMPVREIFAALSATGYKGFVDLEYEIKPEDPMPGVIESFAYMRGVLAGMGQQG